MKHITLSLFMVVIIATQGYSQEEQSIYRKISTLEYMETIPVGNKKDIEKQVKSHKKFDKDSLRILPVVFHIVYTEGMPSISEG